MTSVCPQLFSCTVYHVVVLYRLFFLHSKEHIRKVIPLLFYPYKRTYNRSDSRIVLSL